MDNELLMEEMQCEALSEERQERLKKEERELAEKCGLTYAGENEDGEQEFIGTDEAWARFKQEDVDCHASPEDGCECPNCKHDE